MNAIKPGDHRCPGPSTRDILLEDKQELPWQLLESSNQFAGSDDIAYERYTSADFMAKEFSELWPRVWQWVARSEQLQEVGDLLTYDIGPYSILVARTREGIKAFHNACLHRGTQLRPSDTVGYGQSLRCPIMVGNGRSKASLPRSRVSGTSRMSTSRRTVCRKCGSRSGVASFSSTSTDRRSR
jgi:hypothetical protein